MGVITPPSDFPKLSQPEGFQRERADNDGYTSTHLLPPNQPWDVSLDKTAVGSLPSAHP